MDPKTGGLTSMLMSPPVIIAGVAIGAVLLIMGKGAGASAGASTSASDPAVINATVSMNQAALQAQTSLANTHAQLGEAQLNADSVRQGQILSYLSNVNNNNASIQNTLTTSQAGITQSQIASSTAQSLDILNNNERLNEAYISARTAAGAQLTQRYTSWQAAQTAEHSSDNGVLSTLFGSIGNVATAVTKAFA